MSKSEKRKIIQQSARYCWVDSHLLYTCPNLEIRRCVREDEILHILKAFHDEPCGGNFSNRRTGHKALRMGYYWLTLFRDAKTYVHSCDSCQRMGQPNRLDQMHLQTQLVVGPFDRWALDFIGPIIPHSKQKAYILVYTNYMTKWVEAVALAKANDQVVIDFLYSEIFTHFGVPKEVVTDGGPQFMSHQFEALLRKYHV